MATKASSPNILEYDPARCDALSEVLAERWWVVGLRGIFGIIFGLICLLVPAAAILGLVLLFSAYMLVDGVPRHLFRHQGRPERRSLGTAHP